MMGVLAKLGAKLGGVKRRCGVLTLESENGAKMAVLGDDFYAGSTARRYFCGEEVVRRNYLPRTGGIIKTAERLSRRYGMAMVSNLRVGEEIQERALQSPWFVELESRLPTSSEEYLRTLPTRLREEVKQASQMFTWEFTQAPDYVEMFHEDFYLPTVSASHGNEAICESLEGTWKKLQLGFMLRVFYDGEWIAAGIVACQNGVVRMHHLGLRGGDARRLPRLTTKAIYWATVEFAIKRGFRSLVLGSVAPYPQDGLYFFKDRWGAQINEDLTHRPPHYFFFDPGHAQCQRFLRENALFFWEGKKLSLLTGVGSRGELENLERRTRSVKAVKRVYTIRSDYSDRLVAEGTKGELPRGLRDRLFRVR